MQLGVEFPSECATPSVRSSLVVQLGLGIDKSEFLGQN